MRDYNRSFGGFTLFLFYFHAWVLWGGQLGRLFLLAQTVQEVPVPDPNFLDFLYLHDGRSDPGLPLALAAVDGRHFPDCLIDASVLLDDLLMVGVALYGIASFNIVAHHLIDADAALLLSCQIEQPAHGCQELHVPLVLHLFPVILLYVLADGPAALHLLTRVDVCV